MPAPKRPNTSAATAAVVRRGQETMATKLREAGWVVIPPELIGITNAAVRAGEINLGERTYNDSYVRGD